MHVLKQEHLLKLIANEAFVYRRPFVAIFVVTVLAMLALGFIVPRGYTASTTIRVDEKNIIQPLMQGAAVATDVTDRAQLAREVIFGRKVMSQILEDGGWLLKKPTPTEQEELIKSLIKRTTLATAGRNLIKINYKDDDPERAYLVTKRLAELFIDESRSAKSSESRSAFEFIDRQVTAYHEKLANAEDQLKQFRSEHLDAGPGSEADISAKLNNLHGRIEQAEQELNEAQIRKQSLEKQLSGEAEVATAISRESQFRARIAELQSQMETLRLSYHDSYPDIVHIKHQIEDLNEAIVADRQRRERAKAAGHVVVDDSIMNNPMYQQLRRELSQAQITIDTLKARIAEAKRQLNRELDRGKRLSGGEATLAELTRDYQVNRDIYQDLLRRREAARVSMNLDKEDEGLTFSVQEPATLPLQPNGMRFVHFVVLGPVVGFLLPLAALYAKLQLDMRVRVPTQLAGRHKVAVLATVPHLWSKREVEAIRVDVARLGLVLAGTLFAVVLISALRLIRVV